MCVRCGTGRVAWCTDPTRHGELRSLGPHPGEGDPPAFPRMVTHTWTPWCPGDHPGTVPCPSSRSVLQRVKVRLFDKDGNLVQELVSDPVETDGFHQIGIELVDPPPGRVPDVDPPFDMSDPAYAVMVRLRAPRHWSETEVAEAIDDKLRDAGVSLVIDSVKAVRG